MSLIAGALGPSIVSMNTNRLLLLLLLRAVPCEATDRGSQTPRNSLVSLRGVTTAMMGGGRNNELNVTI